VMPARHDPDLQAASLRFIGRALGTRSP
jgi:hypothetical protein